MTNLFERRDRERAALERVRDCAAVFLRVLDRSTGKASISQHVGETLRELRAAVRACEEMR